MASQTISQLFDLTGKSAIVTGGAVGIGQAIAFRLAEAGASVMIADIDKKAADQTVTQITAKGGKAKAIRADISSSADVKKTVQATVDAFGSLDILVNNAAIYPTAPALEIAEEVWEKVFNLNVKGTFLCCQTAAQEMIKAGHGGKIINLASVSAFHAIGFQASYEASKSSIVMLTKSLALELGPHNILVNAVAPGSVRTPGLVKQIEHLTGGALSLEEATQAHSASLPLRRQGEPDDIAKVVLFLASGAADYMTGALLLVDGGMLLL